MWDLFVSFVLPSFAALTCFVLPRGVCLLAGLALLYLICALACLLASFLPCFFSFTGWLAD